MEVEKTKTILFLRDADVDNDLCNKERSFGGLSFIILYFASMKPVFLFLLFSQSVAFAQTGLEVYEKAWEFQRKESLDSAVKYYQIALKADLAKSDKAGIHINLAIIAKNRGQFDQALEYGFDGLELSKDSTRSRASALNTIASTYYLTGDYSRALEYYLQTLKINRQLGLDTGIARSLNNISNIFMAVEQFDSALIYLHRAIILRNNNDDSKLAGIYNNLGLAYLNLDHYDSAEYYLTKALQIKESEELNSGSHTLRLLGVLYMDTKRPDLSLEFLFKALNTSRSSQLRNVEKETLANLATFYSRRRDYQKEASILKQYILLSDSLLNEEKSKALAEMEVKYESNQKDHEISYLETLRQLQNERISNQQNVILIALISAIALLASSAITFYFFRSAKKRKREIEILHHDMKHRVSNHLQLLMGLLKMRKTEVNDAVALDEINSFENRISAMALLHQKLFSVKKELLLDIQPYFLELTSLLATSNESIRPVDINAKIDTIKLDINLVIYLGLIVSELITNAVKHAFHQVEAARIDVNLETKSDQLLFLEVRDNGIGLADEGIEENSGSELIRIFSKQIGAQTSVFNQKGAVFQFLIPVKSS